MTPGTPNRPSEFSASIEAGPGETYRAKHLNASAGQLTTLPLGQPTDSHHTIRADDGSIIGSGTGLQSTSWKFTRGRFR